jgi:hypothetical protein
MKRARHGTVLPLGSTLQFALLSKSCGFTPLNFLKGTLFNWGEYSLPDYGSVDSVKRPVRTRTRGGVGLLLPINLDKSIVEILS